MSLLVAGSVWTVIDANGCFCFPGPPSAPSLFLSPVKQEYLLGDTISLECSIPASTGLIKGFQFYGTSGWAVDIAVSVKRFSYIYKFNITGMRDGGSHTCTYSTRQDGKLVRSQTSNSITIKLKGELWVLFLSPTSNSYLNLSSQSFSPQISFAIIPFYPFIHTTLSIHLYSSCTHPSQMFIFTYNFAPSHKTVISLANYLSSYVFVYPSVAQDIIYSLRACTLDQLLWNLLNTCTYRAIFWKLLIDKRMILWKKKYLSIFVQQLLHHSLFAKRHFSVMLFSRNGPLNIVLQNNCSVIDMVPCHGNRVSIKHGFPVARPTWLLTPPWLMKWIT